jgi:uncharacterized protein (DUF305 family)
MDHEKNVYPFRIQLDYCYHCHYRGRSFMLGIRQQVSVGDEQFVKGMIPTHAAALLMSEKQTQILS